MSEYRQAVKNLTKDERIVVAHLEELIGNMKAVRVATVFKGQEALIAREIEMQVMEKLMPHFIEEIQKERSKIDLLLHEANEAISKLNQIKISVDKSITRFERNMKILGHIQALAKEGKAEIILPPTAAKPTDTKDGGIGGR